MRSRSPLTGEEDLSGGRPGGCQGLSGGGGTLTASLADLLGLAILKGSLAGPTGMWWRTERGSTEVAPKVLLMKGGET